MESINNTQIDNLAKSDKCNECDDLSFSPQISHNLLVNGVVNLSPSILLTSPYSINRCVEIWAEQVFYDKLLISGVIYNKIIYNSVDNCGMKLYHVSNCYNTPFQCFVPYPCNDISTCPNDYEVHGSINDVIYSYFPCIDKLCNHCKKLGFKLSEEYLIYITVRKKCKCRVCEEPICKVYEDDPM